MTTQNQNPEPHATHTPGPWTVDPESPASGAAEDQGDIITTADRLRTIAEVHHHVGHEDETRPNARLIAAAPDLLESLEEAVAIEESHTAQNDPDGGGLAWAMREWANDARTAIARATGADA